MLLSEAFEAYRTDVIVFRNQSVKTEENNKVCLRALLIYFGDVPIESLTFPMIRDWKIELSKHRSTETVRNYIVRFRVVLRMCSSRGIPCLTPEEVPIPKREDKVPAFISKEDVAQLIVAVSKPVAGYARANRLRNAAIIATLYASGIRVSELCAMNRLDLHDNSFTVIGKGRKARLCFLDDRAQWLINEYLSVRHDNNEALFLSVLNNKRITPGNVQEIFRLASRKAGMNVSVHPHTLRHSFATNLMSNGMHMYSLQRLLGHNSIQTTEMYLHITDPQLQENYNKYHTV